LSYWPAEIGTRQLFPLLFVNSVTPTELAVLLDLEPFGVPGLPARPIVTVRAFRAG